MPYSPTDDADLRAPTMAGGGVRRFCSCGEPITVWPRAEPVQFQPVRCRVCGRQIWRRDVTDMLMTGGARIGGAP